jgi:hypothetical protein
MSDDDNAPADGPTPAPEARKRWSEQDRQTLVITIVGGLAANLVTVIAVGAAIGLVRLISRHGSGRLSDLVIITVVSVVLIVMGHVARKSTAPTLTGWRLRNSGWMALVGAACSSWLRFLSGSGWHPG